MDHVRLSPATLEQRVYATATAVRALQAYLPLESSAERENAVRRAREWLIRTRPQSTEDAAFRLMGLVWAGGSSEGTGVVGRDLIERQRADGGWPQLPRYDSDAYSTGEALYALREAGVSTTDPVWRKGLKFLVSTQARDGTWRVRTRMISPATVSPEYFTTGFPYRKDEFLSYAGSCWAVMALMSALPEQPSLPGVAQCGAGPGLAAAVLPSRGLLLRARPSHAGRATALAPTVCDRRCA